METSITSEMVSQNTICREIKGSTKDWEIPGIAKKVLWASNTDKEHDKDLSSEGITEIEQTAKNLNKARETYFNLIQTQKKSTAQMKHTAMKRTVGEDCRMQVGKVP